MERFEPPHPLAGSAPEKFSLSLSGGGVIKIDGSFAGVTREHEIDAIVTALLAVRPLLRRNTIQPIPRSHSLVLVTPPSNIGR